MPSDEIHDAERRSSPQPDQGGDPPKFLPSVKFVDKMERLAKWRIDPSSLTFPEDAREFHGGNAIVSRAVLNTSSFDGGKIDDVDARMSTGQKVVAVKKLNLTPDKDPERVLGLTLREAGFLVELSHENIIKLEGLVEKLSNGILWLVFPWEDNGNLRDFIASGDWEIPERISLIDDVSRGVEYLHSQEPPIYHGDLKSVNVLVNSKCRGVITDFGSARRLAKDNPGERAEDTGNQPPPTPLFQATFSAATNTITLTGNEYTLRWAAPELLMDEQPSLRSDIWALGWISYEVMTNTIPFEDVKKDAIVINRVIKGDLPSINGHARMSLIQGLCSLMIMCWNIDPMKRPMADEFQKMIYYMPMMAPNPKRITDPTAPRVHSPALLLLLGKMHGAQDDYHSASTFFTEALNIYTDISDREGRAEALYRLADLHRSQSKADEAFKLYSEALKIFTDTGNRKRRADTLWGLAHVHRSRHDNDQAFRFFSDALQACGDLGDIHGRAHALLGLASVHVVRGEYSEAITFYSETLQIFTDGGSRVGKAEALKGLGDIHRLRKEFSQATSLYSDALQIWTDIGDALGRANTLSRLADVHREQNHHNEAIALYEQASEIYAKLGDETMAAGVLKNAADVRQLLGHVEAE